MTVAQIMDLRDYVAAELDRAEETGDAATLYAKRGMLHCIQGHIDCPTRTSGMLVAEWYEQAGL